MMASMSVELNAFWRSVCLATSPLETFTKTLMIWITSSRFVSLGVFFFFSQTSCQGEVEGDIHAVSPFLYFILVTSDLDGCIRYRERKLFEGLDQSLTSNL